MIHLPKYSFDVEFKEIEFPNIKIEFIPDRKQITREEYNFLEVSIDIMFLVWRTISQCGGFDEKLSEIIRGPGFQSYYQYGRKKWEFSAYIEEGELNTLKNLFHLVEHSYNIYPEYENKVKISKIKISSIPCDYLNFIEYKRGYL